MSQFGQGDVENRPRSKYSVSASANVGGVDEREPATDSVAEGRSGEARRGTHHWTPVRQKATVEANDDRTVCAARQCALLQVLLDDDLQTGIVQRAIPRYVTRTAAVPILTADVFQAEEGSGGLWLTRDGWFLGELCGVGHPSGSVRLVLFELNEDLLTTVPCDIDFLRAEREMCRLAEYVRTGRYLAVKNPAYFVFLRELRPELLAQEPVAVVASSVQDVEEGFELVEDRFLVI